MKFLSCALAALTLMSGSGANRAAQDCEACGLVVWRMQMIVAARAKELVDIRAAKEKRAAKSQKAHNKRWIKQEYGVELAAAIEAEVDSLAKDSRIMSGACRPAFEAIEGSALRGDRFDKQCSSRVQSRVGDLLSEYQDDLASAVVAGLGAGAACAKLLRCKAERATYVLGPDYRDELELDQLDHLMVGYRDAWEMHKDVDGSE